MKVLVVIVNHRIADPTMTRLPRWSRPASRGVSPARVVVVDNCSGDGSAARIAGAIAERGWGAWALLVEAERNGGFAYGNNRGIEAAAARWPRPAYVHLLNPDTVVRPGALGLLLAFLEANPSVGIAGSRLEDPDGTRSGPPFASRAC